MLAAKTWSRPTNASCGDIISTLPVLIADKWCPSRSATSTIPPVPRPSSSLVMRDCKFVVRPLSDEIRCLWYLEMFYMCDAIKLYLNQRSCSLHCCQSFFNAGVQLIDLFITVATDFMQCGGKSRGPNDWSLLEQIALPLRWGSLLKEVILLALAIASVGVNSLLSQLLRVAVVLPQVASRSCCKARHYFISAALINRSIAGIGDKLYGSIF